jgi:hypothetical protein
MLSIGDIAQRDGVSKPAVANALAHEGAHGLATLMRQSPTASAPR